MDNYQPDSVDDLIAKESRKVFEIEKQFKKDFGMTLSEAEAINEKRKKESNELYYLRCLLNGLDITTHTPANPTEEERERISKRIDDLIN
jgi:hypothetical protein